MIDNDINSNASKDAWTTFFNSKNQANQSRTDAENYKAQGKNALVGGAINLGSTATCEDA